MFSSFTVWGCLSLDMFRMKSFESISRTKYIYYRRHFSNEQQSLIGKITSHFTPRRAKVSTKDVKTFFFSEMTKKATFLKDVSKLCVLLNSKADITLVLPLWSAWASSSFSSSWLACCQTVFCSSWQGWALKPQHLWQVVFVWSSCRASFWLVLSPLRVC